GEGLFFAGSAHVALQVVASPDEHRLITTNPRELAAMDEEDSKQMKIAQMLDAETPGSLSNMPSTPPAAGSSPQNAQSAPAVSNQASNTVPAASTPNRASGAPDLAISPTPSLADDDSLSKTGNGLIGSPDLPLPKPKSTTSKDDDDLSSPATPQKKAGQPSTFAYTSTEIEDELKLEPEELPTSKESDGLKLENPNPE